MTNNRKSDAGQLPAGADAEAARRTLAAAGITALPLADGGEESLPSLAADGDEQ